MDKDLASKRLPANLQTQILVLLVILATHLALLAEILATEGRSGWLLAGMIAATNLALGLVLGRSFRFGRLPVMILLATTALTEAFLWRPAMTGRGANWIATGAVLGVITLAGCWFAMRWADFRGRRRR